MQREGISSTVQAHSFIEVSELPKVGIECIVIRRMERDGVPISASRVRECMREGNRAFVKAFVPLTTFDYFLEPEAKASIDRIRKE